MALSSAEKMREWRLKKLAKQKEINRRYYLKQTLTSKKNEQKKLKNREYQRRYKAKRNQSLETVNLISSPNENLSSYSNRMGKYRAIKKMKNALPNTPTKRAEVLTTYLSHSKSPAAKVYKNVLEKEMNCMGDALMKDVNDIMKSVKAKRNKNTQAVKNIVSACLSGDSTEQSKVKVKLAKQLGMTPKRLSGGKRLRHNVIHSEDSSWKFTARKTRSDSTTDDVRKRAYDYWLLPSNSRPTGNKSDIKRVRLSPKTYSSHMIHILERTQTEIYNSFKADNPEIKMGQRLFESCKPYFIRQTRAKDRNTCCCRYHVEAQTAFKHAMEFRRKLFTQHEITPAEYPIYQNLDNIVDATLCPVSEGDLPLQKCLDRKCAQCGVSSIQLHPDEASLEPDAPDVTWEKYEYKSQIIKEKTRRKLVLTKQTTKPGELFKHLKSCLSTFASHQFRANWQSTQFKNLKENLPLNHVICVHDFSENYRCGEKNEIQSTYFQRIEITLHVTILHRHANLQTDAVESTEENPCILTEQIFVISSDLSHDHYFTHEVQRQVALYLQSIGYNLETTTLHEFTDGCQQQYKSRHCMGDFCSARINFGYKHSIRNYYETSHAKGPQDAAGGLIKQQADLAVTRGKAHIQCSADLYNFAEKTLKNVQKSNVCKRRIFFCCDKIPRDIITTFKPIPNNRAIHQIQTTASTGLLHVRQLSCYKCDNCIDGKYDECQNTDQTGEFRPVQILSEDSQTDANDEHISDLVTKDAIIAVLADDPVYEYYLIKALGTSEILTKDTTDDFGTTYASGTEVIRGNYFDRNNSDHLSYKIIARRLALVPALSVKHICTGVTLHQKRRTITLREQIHQDILSSLTM